MIKQYYQSEEDQRLEFARAAAKHFEDHPEHSTYTKGGIEKGCFFALRWGMGQDCVLVFKVHEYEDIINYCSFIDRERASLVSQYHNAGMTKLEELPQ